MKPAQHRMWLLTASPFPTVLHALGALTVVVSSLGLGLQVILTSPCPTLPLQYLQVGYCTQSGAVTRTPQQACMAAELACCLASWSLCSCL